MVALDVLHNGRLLGFAQRSALVARRPATSAARARVASTAQDVVPSRRRPAPAVRLVDTAPFASANADDARSASTHFLRFATQAGSGPRLSRAADEEQRR
jgi:hypothetical protein